MAGPKSRWSSLLLVTLARRYGSLSALSTVLRQGATYIYLAACKSSSRVAPHEPFVVLMFPQFSIGHSRSPPGQYGKPLLVRPSLLVGGESLSHDEFQW